MNTPFLHMSLSGLVWFITTILALFTMSMIILITIVITFIISKKSSIPFRQAKGFYIFKGLLPVLGVTILGVMAFPDFFQTSTKCLLDDFSLFYIIILISLMVVGIYYQLKNFKINKKDIKS